METGIVHECMNFAKLKNLNILFVCEDNGCSVYSPKEVRQPHDVSLCAQAESYGINSLCVENSSDIFQLQKQSLQYLNLSGIIWVLNLFKSRHHDL